METRKSGVELQYDGAKGSLFV